MPRVLALSTVTVATIIATIVPLVIGLTHGPGQSLIIQGANNNNRNGAIKSQAWQAPKDLPRVRSSSRTAPFLFHLLKHKLLLEKLGKIPTTPAAIIDCICVPYYLCNTNGTIITDGIGIIDIRFRRCTGDQEICCRLPSITQSMAPIVTPTMTTTTARPTTPTTKPTTPTTTKPTTPTTAKPTTSTMKPTTPTTATTRTTPTTTTTLSPIIFPTGPPTVAPTILPTGSPNINCICVAISQCDPNGIIGVSGEGLIDPRQQASLCASVGQVCCRLGYILVPNTAPPIILPTVLPGVPGQSQLCVLCGNVIQCFPTGMLVPSDGTGIIDPRLQALQTSCGQGCCGSSATNGITNAGNTNILGPLKNANTPYACYCVKSWMCMQGNAVSIDGVGAIDPRFTACASPDEVCCRLAGIDIESMRSAKLIPSASRDAFIITGPSHLNEQEGCGTRNTSRAPAQPFSPDSGRTYYGEVPWMVALLVKQSNGQYVFQCGGSMINNRAVLTAAHCVARRDVDTTLVARFGVWDIKTSNSSIQQVNVQAAVSHPLYYAGGLYHDVAVLILEKAVQYDMNVKPICLPEQGMSFATGTRCFGTGWGRSSFGADGQYQTELHKVDVPIVDRSDCQNRLRSTRLGQFFQLHGSFLCAGGEPSRDTCSGDGGGPLTCQSSNGRFVQAGIVSWGIGCGANNVPAVYASVPQHRQWIDQQLANYGVQ